MALMDVLKERFDRNTAWHPDLSWEQVVQRLQGDPRALDVLARMEATGGEPAVIGTDEDGRIIFADCSRETPALRRSLCYDDIALRKRTKNPPSGSAVRQAEEIGAELMTEALYRRLQELGEFDSKTSSWIATPAAIRELGGALFCERRYGAVFTFHNGADSYYAVRGWRGFICV